MSIPQLFLEQICLGEREPDSLSAAEEAELRKSTAAILKSNEEILAAYPAGDMKQRVLSRLQEREEAEKPARKTRVFPVARTITLAAAACCVLAVSFLALQTKPVTANPELSSMTDRVKGNGPKLFVYLKDGEKAILLVPDTRVAKDDTLQVSYIAGGDTWGAIISVDGNGVITQHYPESGDMTEALSAKGEVPLDFSYKLDNAPEFERFFFVSGPIRFSTTRFKDELSKAAVGKVSGDFAIPDALPGGSHVTEIRLRK